MIVCAMIVGPGEGDRYLLRVLRSAREWADHIVVLKDHVDAITAAQIDVVATEFPRPHPRAARVWSYDIADATTFRSDESAVRNGLLKLLDIVPYVRPDDLVVVLDADEELRVPEGTVRTALTRLVEYPSRGVRAWSMRFFHLWAEDGSTYRVDGGWAPHMQDRIYRHQSGARIEPRQLACRAIPESIQSRGESVLEVLHWGYARPADRVRKHEHYMAVDGGRFHSRAHLESIIGTPELRPV